MNFDMRINDMELRSCGKHLLRENIKHNTAEIVKWEDDYCYTVAYWIKSKDGYSLHFVSERPFGVHW